MQMNFMQCCQSFFRKYWWTRFY